MSARMAAPPHHSPVTHRDPIAVRAWRAMIRVLTHRYGWRIIVAIAVPLGWLVFLPPPKQVLATVIGPLIGKLRRNPTPGSESTTERHAHSTRLAEEDVVIARRPDVILTLFRHGWF